jgi:protoheme IX farnesyltransferase
MSLIKTYISLTKPGIIFGNVITAAGGFFLAAKVHNNLWLFLATMIGLSLVIASGCVFNNYIDRSIDEKMTRTKNRALVKKLIPSRNAIIYGILLGLFGVLLLSFYTNLLTVFLALAGFFFYVVLYGIWKRRSVYGTIIGSVSGAVPPVAGYCAVTNRFDSGAIILFMILVLWQMPHFYAIALYRLHDYAAAKIPVLPVKKSMLTTKIHMLVYIIGFIIASSLLTVFGYTGYAYLIVVLLLGLGWFGFAIKGFKTNNDTLWARKMFTFSLIVITLLCVMLSIDATRLSL